jgi:hypothetical protein
MNAMVDSDGTWKFLERISGPKIFCKDTNFNSINFLFDEEYSTWWDKRTFLNSSGYNIRAKLMEQSEDVAITGSNKWIFYSQY